MRPGADDGNVLQHNLQLKLSGALGASLAAQAGAVAADALGVAAPETEAMPGNDRVGRAAF